MNANAMSIEQTEKKRNLPRTCIRSTSMCTIGHNLVMLTVMEKLIFQFISSHVRCTISNTTQTLRVLFSGFSKAFKLWQFQCDAKKQMSKVCNSVSFIFSGFDGQYVCVCSLQFGMKPETFPIRLVRTRSLLPAGCVPAVFLVVIQPSFSIECGE